MSVHVPRHATLVCLSLCVLAVMAVIFGGCADTGSGSSTTVSTAPPDTGSSTTTPSIPQLSQWDRELAKTAKIENNLAVALQAEQAPENDPRRGIVAGLRARNLAIATRQFAKRQMTWFRRETGALWLDIPPGEAPAQTAARIARTVASGSTLDS